MMEDVQPDQRVLAERGSLPIRGESRPWWEKPYRIVQTNLRLIDGGLDPDELAREVCEFGASALTFNVGGIFAFYPTKLPLHALNPYLAGDLVGDMLEAAHRAGLKMVGRFDLSKGTQIAYSERPDWFVHNKDGKPQEYNGTYQACVNSGWAKDYSLRILQESLSRYELDGAFFNMTGYQPVDYTGTYHGICWCRNCQDGFAEMFDRRLPEREDFSDPSYADYLQFKIRTSEVAAQRIYDTVKSLRPRTGVMGNGQGACDFMRLELQRAVSRPAPEWPHQAGELARWGAAVGKGKPYSCASTNFLDYQWRYSSETPAHHLLRFGQSIANGAQIDYYLLGTLRQDNPAPLETVRKFMHWHAGNEEHFVATKSHARVGLYHSRATDLHARATKTAAQHVNGFRGAYRLLLEGRIPFDFISDERVSDADVAEQLDPYDVILLPNVACMNDAEAAALDRYVEQGGTLIATGETGLYDERGSPRQAFALRSLPVTSLKQAADGLETYFETAQGEPLFPDTRLLHLDGWYFDCNSKKESERLLKLQPQPKYGPPELCFAELPPTESAGVLSRPYGQGRGVYLPWLPEWLYFRDGLPEHRELFLKLIDRATQPLVKLKGAGPIEITVRRKERGEGDLVIHLVNYAGQRHSAYEEPPAIGGLQLGVKGGAGLAKALVNCTILELSELDEDGYAWLDLPEIKFFEAIVVSGRPA